MAEAVDAIAVDRARRRHHPGPRRLRRGWPVRHGPAHPRAPGGRARTSSGSCRTGCATGTTSAPPGSPRRNGSARRSSSPATAASRRWTRCATRGRPASAWSSPTTTCPGPELPPALAVVDPQRADDTSDARVALRHRHRLQAGAGARARARACRRTCPTTCSIWWRSPRWPTSCRSLGENRILVRHGLRLLAESRWPGLRALVEAAGLAGRELRAGHMGYMLGPRLNAAGRIGDAADGLRLLLTDDPAEALELARRLEGLNVERQSLDQRMLEEALAQVEQAGDPERDAGFVLAGDGWHPGVVGHRGVARGRAVRPAGVSDRLRRRRRQGLRPEHLAVRPPRGAARLRRPARALRRAPDGRGAHHPARPAGRVPRALRRDRPGGARPGRPGPRAAGGPRARPRRGHPRARADVPPPRAVRGGEREPGVRRAGRAVHRPLAGGQRAPQGHARRRRARGSPRSASSGPTGCPGWATGWWTRRSGWSPTSGTATRRCRRGCARCRRTGWVGRPVGPSGGRAIDACQSPERSASGGRIMPPAAARPRVRPPAARRAVG